MTSESLRFEMRLQPGDASAFLEGARLDATSVTQFLRAAAFERLARRRIEVTSASAVTVGRHLAAAGR